MDIANKLFEKSSKHLDSNLPSFDKPEVDGQNSSKKEDPAKVSKIGVRSGNRRRK